MPELPPINLTLDMIRWESISAKVFYFFEIPRDIPGRSKINKSAKPSQQYE